MIRQKKNLYLSSTEKKRKENIQSGWIFSGCDNNWSMKPPTALKLDPCARCFTCAPDNKSRERQTQCRNPADSRFESESRLCARQSRTPRG